MTAVHNAGRSAEAPRRRHGWLELVQTSGPFLTLPVVDRAFPNGMPAVPAEVRASVRSVVSRMLDDAGASRHAVVTQVLCGALDWGDHLRQDHDLPDTLAEVIPEHGAVVRPAFAFIAEDDADALDDDAHDDDPDDAAADATGPYRLLGTITPWGTNPLTRTGGDGWRASPVERLSALLRARDVPVGITTDGRWWALVWAPRGGTTGAAVWDASLWSEEPESFAAFIALLSRARFLAAAPRDRLPSLFGESLGRQEELTDNLSAQVREAVELLVLTLDRLDVESNGALLDGVDDDALYAGVVTMMMRIVFLLFAEERRLLRSDADAYQRAYSVGRLVEQLEQRAALAGEQTLEHRTGAWHRLLAVSRLRDHDRVDPDLVMDPVQVAAIAARCGQVAPQYELLVLAMGQSGLRPSEAISLRRCDVDLDSVEEAVFVVGSSYTPAPERFLAAGESRERPLKGRGAKYRRRVPIPPQLARHLHDYLEERGGERPDAFVFPNSDGGRIDLSNFSRDVWNDARREVFPAGSPLRKVRRHDLRHSAITAWLNAGVPIKTAQVWSGHRTASTLLDTYLGVMRHDEALGRARIEQAFGSAD